MSSESCAAKSWDAQSLTLIPDRLRAERMVELFEHTADLGLRVRAASLEELLVEAGHGLLAMLVANPEAVQAVEPRTIRLTADEPSYLLFDWLNELLYLFETEKLLMREFNVELSGLALTATCRGEPLDPTRHQPDHEVKAITYHGLSVRQTPDGWMAEVIVDI
jgi:SHS2 domain-containing protein